jgi:tetratricopeptide (TPR) repeat protein
VLLVSFLLLSVVSIKYYKRSMGEIYFQSFVQSLTDADYNSARSYIEKTIALCPDNAYFLAQRGLLEIRAAEIEFNPQIFINGDILLKGDAVNSAITATHYYLLAIKLNPRDDSYYHNLGWLYALLDQPDKALEAFRQAVFIDGNIAMYHISIGLVQERKGDIEESIVEYARAISLSPIISDSPFFKDLQERSPVISEEVFNRSILYLEKELQKSSSPIIAARLGKLYLHRQSLNDATEILQKALAMLPNLSRPWIYLGDIHLLQGDEKKAILFYEKANFLDKYDVFTCLRLGQAYDRGHRSKEAINYYTKALNYSSAQMSDHAARSSRLYNSWSIVANDVLVKNLLGYCSPTLNKRDIYLRLATLYSESGNSRLAKYYADNSQKL